MRLERDDGASAVEFALVMPLLFLLIFGIIQFGLGFYTQQGASSAAREAARRAAVGAVKTCSGGTAATDLDSIVKSYTSGASIDGETLANGNGAIGDTVTVTVNYHIDLDLLSAFIPGMTSKISNLKQSAQARIEQPGTVASCP